METSPPTYSRRNRWAAGAALLLTTGYWWLLHALTAEGQAHTRNGYEGEASFIVFIPLGFIYIYLCFCSLVLVVESLRRGSRPASKALLVWGLGLPALLLLLLLPGAL